MELPQEILGMILGHFVGPFEHGSGFSQESVYEHCHNRKTLASLCRVSKSFNSVVKGLLYGQVRMFDGDIRLFMRTILQDQLKSKTNLVKGLSLEFRLPGGDIDDLARSRVPSVREGQWSYERCLREASAVVGVEYATESVAGGWESDILTSKDLDLKDKREEDLAAVLLFLLPDLRELRVNMDPMTYWRDPESVGYWTCEMLLQTLRLSYFNNYMKPDNDSGSQENQGRIETLLPVGLLNLEQLIMCNPYEEAGCVKESYPPIVWCDIDELQPLWTLPKLKKLTLERVTGSVSTNYQTNQPKEFVEAATLEHLELSNTAIEPSGLPNFLQYFPSLRSIRYEVADTFSLTHRDHVLLTRDMFDLDGIRGAIQRCKPNLEEITIIAIERKDFTDYELEDFDELLNEQDEYEDEDEDEHEDADEDDEEE